MALVTTFLLITRIRRALLVEYFADILRVEREESYFAALVGIWKSDVNRIRVEEGTK
jgi:hypothetical protein